MQFRKDLSRDKEGETLNRSENDPEEIFESLPHPLFFHPSN